MPEKSETIDLGKVFGKIGPRAIIFACKFVQISQRQDGILEREGINGMAELMLLEKQGKELISSLARNQVEGEPYTGKGLLIADTYEAAGILETTEINPAEVMEVAVRRLVEVPQTRKGHC